MQKEVIINFESEDREGIVAVGTYLIDAAKRLGIDVDCDCNLEEVEETTNSCAMKISNGGDLLSEPTNYETEHLSSQARKNGERLACQTKFEKAGEVTVMSVKKKVSEEEAKTAEEEAKENFKKEFEELPLEKKIANLLELEAIALSETFSYVMNSPYAAVGKVMDVLAEFGLKMEQDDVKAKRPDEHITPDEHEFVDIDTDEEEKSSSKKKSSTTAKKKSASKSTAKKKVTVKKTNTKKEEEKEEKEDKDSKE